jgi:hypothetical protein
MASHYERSAFGSVGSSMTMDKFLRHLGHKTQLASHSRTRNLNLNSYLQIAPLRGGFISTERLVEQGTAAT